MIYLDWNATTPPLDEALDAMRAAERDCWANPSSVHRPGQAARAQLDAAREAIAVLVARHQRDVVLTSGGTEANNLALWQPFLDGPTSEDGAGALVLSRLEHPSILSTAEGLARRGVELRWIDVCPDGTADLASLERALSSPARLVTLQAVNHETGVIQPIDEATALAHAAGALMHVDAVQAVGKIPLALSANMVTVAAHKIRGPKGIGALIGREGLKLRPLLRGGEQERGLRPGTQSAALAAGFAVAARHAVDSPAHHGRVLELRDELEARLIAMAARHQVRVERNGYAARVPHVTNLSWQGWRAPELCAALDLEGLAVSSGSACAAGTAAPSPVVTAMLGATRARSAVRFSLGETTKPDDVHRACVIVERVLERMSGNHS